MRELQRRAVRWVSRLLLPILLVFLRLLLRSWRYRLVDPSGSLSGLKDRGRPVILAFWHSDLIPCGSLVYRTLVSKGYPVTGLVSRSADGEILARAAASFRFRTIRGSTSRGGLAALRNLYRQLKRGSSIVIAPDGPRGPARTAQTGVVQVAVLSGAPILPMAAAARRAWRARSWDRTVVPKPFTEIVVTVGEELRFEPGSDLEREAARLAAALDDLRHRAETHPGQPPGAP